MTILAKTLIAAALLVSAPALAEEAHHTPSAAAGTTAADAATQPNKTNAMSDGGAMGMMSGDMMKMMKQMMGAHAEMMRGMMSSGGMGMGDGERMGQMMSPDRMEGRIAFLRAELKVTAAQQPLWDAVADALRAGSIASQSMMPATTGGTTQPDAARKALPRKLSDLERMLSTRLDGVRRLTAALDPFYASLDENQKTSADELLIPMGM